MDKYAGICWKVSRSRTSWINRRGTHFDTRNKQIRYRNHRSNSRWHYLCSSSCAGGLICAVTPIFAKIFVDDTYEGDLAALSGVDYHVGREAREDFGEPHAGKIFTWRGEEAAHPREAALGLLNLRALGNNQIAHISCAIIHYTPCNLGKNTQMLLLSQ